MCMASGTIYEYPRLGTSFLYQRMIGGSMDEMDMACLKQGGKVAQFYCRYKMYWHVTALQIKNEKHLYQLSGGYGEWE